MPQLKALNKLTAKEAEQSFLRCCGSAQWAKKLSSARPFLNQEQLFQRAEEIWFSLSTEDWLEAFSHHPRIGGRSTQSWANQEQRGAHQASEKTRLALQKGNLEYERKFGHVFLVCASGKTADEMLAILQRRITNDASEEMKNASQEQAKIMKIRLQKLLDGEK
jgi:2-oxo-4-hydroxy-4-carboxy-5-ureidoimidazoline decarboxylase